MVSESSDRDPVEQLAEEFLQRRRRGENPSVSDYADAHPDLADAIRDVFPALLIVEDADPGTIDLRAGTTDTLADVEPLATRCVGDFHIIREIGRGAMGIVYEAEQLSLGRRVALKVLPRSLADQPRSSARFRNEARAAARLHHTNIVPVYEVGQNEGFEFYAMQLINGQSLDKVLKELTSIRCGHPERLVDDSDPTAARTAAISLCRGRFAAPVALHQDSAAPERPVPDGAEYVEMTEVNGDPHHTIPRDEPSVGASPGEGGASLSETGPSAYFHSVAQIGAQVADALDHAHARGIVHRDIKPSNLILDLAGIVWVADFGLAKFEGDNVTRTGDIVGTILHMAPERFRGQCGPAADIYSLGTTLYELLTLQPIFEATDRLSLIERIRVAEPVPPRKIDSRIPRDLETIFTKATAKEQANRYQSAGDMAEDLRRFLNDQPVRARRISLPERTLRWVRRNRMVATLGTACLLLLIGAALTFALVARQAIAREAHTRILWYAASIPAAMQAWIENNPAFSASLLEPFIPAGNEEDLREFSWRYVKYLIGPWERCQRIDQPDCVLDIRLSPDGSLVAVEHRRGGITVWDLASGELAFNVREGIGTWLLTPNIAFSPVGKLLAYRDFSGNRLHLLNLESEQERQLQLKGEGAIWHAFSGTGHFLAAISQDGELSIWELCADMPIPQDRDIDTPVSLATFSPVSNLLAIVSNDQDIKIHDLDRQEELVSFQAGQSVSSLVFSQDGRSLAVVDGHHQIAMYDVRSGKPTLEFKWAGAGSATVSLRFLPDGTLVAWTLPSHNELSYWNSRTRQTRTLIGHQDSIRSLDVSPDGTTIATGSRDGTIRLWDLLTGAQVEVIKVHSGIVDRVVFSHDGKILGSGGQDYTVALHPIAARRPIETLSESSPIVNLSLTEDGKTLLTLHENGRLLLRDSTHGDLIQAEFPEDGAITAFDISLENVLVIGTKSGQIHLWDLSAGRLLRTTPAHSQAVTSVSLFAGTAGYLLASASEDDSTLWDLREEPSSTKLPFVRHVAFSPQGTFVVGSLTQGIGFPGEFRYADAGLWDVNSGTPKTVIACQFPLAFSHDERFLAGTGKAHTLVVQDLAKGRAVGPPVSHRDFVTTVAFSRDGRYVASGSFDNTINLWELSGNGGVSTLNGHRASVWQVQFSRDGKTLLSTGGDSTVRTWSVQSRQQLLSLAHKTGRTSGFALSTDETLLVSYHSYIRELRFWRAIAK